MQQWYRNAVFYSVSVEAFMDGDGDGVGDFSGLRHRLDYLESLGVDVLWLAPTQPTPDRDDGYDITDYFGIDGRLGSSGEFVEFLSEAEGRDMRVLLDLVVNHTSDRHPWFLSARASSRSPYRDWYVWSRKRPPAARSGVVFPGAQATTWSSDRKARSWYFHRFYDFEPDLNLENDRVREEIHRVVGYWLHLGVSGFRVEKPQPDGGLAKLQFEFPRELRELVQWRRGDAILLGEANVVPRDDQEYFAGGDGLHMMFNFWVNQQSTDERNGGFSTSEQLVRPVVDDGPYGFHAINVEEQLRRPTSLLRWMTEMIRIRKECPEIGTGAWRILPTRSRHVLAIVYAQGRSSVLCVHNFDAEPKEISLGERLRGLLGNGESHRSAGRHRLRLEPLGYDWYRTA